MHDDIFVYDGGGTNKHGVKNQQESQKMACGRVFVKQIFEVNQRSTSWFAWCRRTDFQLVLFCHAACYRSHFSIWQISLLINDLDRESRWDIGWEGSTN